MDRYIFAADISDQGVKDVLREATSDGSFRVHSMGVCPIINPEESEEFGSLFWVLLEAVN